MSPPLLLNCYSPASYRSLFYKRASRVKSERQWYIEQLNFEFSGFIDSVGLLDKPRGYIIFQLSNSHINKNREAGVNEKLKHNVELVLLDYLPDEKYLMASEICEQYKQGDSLYVNTDQNVVKVFRNETLVAESTVTRSLRGRSF